MAHDPMPSREDVVRAQIADRSFFLEIYDSHEELREYRQEFWQEFANVVGCFGDFFISAVRNHEKKQIELVSFNVMQQFAAVEGPALGIVLTDEKFWDEWGDLFICFHWLHDEIRDAVWSLCFQRQDVIEWVDSVVRSEKIGPLETELRRWRIGGDDLTAIADALLLQRKLERPFDERILLAGFLSEWQAHAYGHVPIAEALRSQRGTPEADVAALLGLKQPLAPEPLKRQYEAISHAQASEVVVISDICEAATEIHTLLGSRTFHIIRPYLLGALIADRQLQVALENLGYDVDELRRSLAPRFVRPGINQPLEAWSTALRVTTPFHLANRPASDLWTRDDSLGYAKYAQAIADSILFGNTQPPLTIGIQAPWGQGKTSLMRMIQARLDRDAIERDVPSAATAEGEGAIRATYRQLLVWLKQPNRLKRLFGAVAPKQTNLLQANAKTIPTVWFNPLYYRETSQVWAGLAHAILHQLAQQLPAKMREEFWLRLQMSRINVAAVRRDVHFWLFTRGVPRGLFWIAVGLAIGLADISQLLKGGIGIATVLAAALDLWKKIADRTLDRPFEKYVTEPSYHTELGLLHLVDHDLDRALRLLVGDGRIAVFIDDLDRCDPGTVNQIVLAINQFLSLPNRNVYFFLGMDMEMVAAALEQAQKETAAAHGSGMAASRRTFGWRFMEKFVQLPFVIPHLDAPTAKKFATAHLRAVSGITPTPAGKTKIDVDAMLAAADRAAAPADVGRIARQVAATEDLDPADRARLEEKFSSRTTVLMQEPESEEVQRIVELAVDDLELNPRTIKRYFSLVRVLRNIQIATGAVRNADDDRKLVLRTAHLLLNWPQFVQWLRNTPEALGDGNVWHPAVKEVERTVAASASPQEWVDAMKKLLGHDPPPYMTDVSLHRYLRKLAAEPPGLAAMYESRMF